MNAILAVLDPLRDRRWWLHFIGCSYYTPSSFAREARRHGVTRRVAPQVLKQMRFGDLALCAVGNRKRGVVFGFFKITTLSGLSPEAFARVRERLDVEVVDFGGVVVRRRCGEYMTGPTCAVKSDIPHILEAAGDADLGKPMVGGPWADLPRFHLLDVRHRQGFRRLDMGRLLDALTVRGGERNAHVAARGQFYVWAGATEVPGPGEGMIGEVVDYHRAEELKTGAGA